MSKPKIICLCGSSRFIETFAVLSWEFEKQGWICLGLHLLPPGYPTKVADHIAEAEGVAEQMDALHLQKIDLADLVFVVNEGGYIGDSTRREIEYARRAGKPVKYMEGVMKNCEIRWCGTPADGLVSVNENIGDGSFRVVICDQCAAALGLKEGDDLPEPAVVKSKIEGLQKAGM